MQRLALLLVLLAACAIGLFLWLSSDPGRVDPIDIGSTPRVASPARVDEEVERASDGLAESQPERASTEPAEAQRSTVATNPAGTAWIKGNVYSGNKRGLGGATVLGWLKLGDDWQQVATGETRADGTYSVEARGLAGLDEILPGPEIWLQFSAEGHQDASQRAVRDPKARGTWQASARLLEGASLVGRVVDRTGAPVPDAEVNYDLQVEVTGLNVPTSRRGPKPVRADAEGRYRLGVPPGLVKKIVARKLGRGYVERVLEIQVTTEDVALDDLVIGSLERIAGRVVYPDGRPARGLSLVAQQTIDISIGSKPADMGRAPGGAPIVQNWTSRTRTGEDGGFSFEDLLPGSYTIIEQDLDVIGIPQRGGNPMRQTWGKPGQGVAIQTGRTDLLLETLAVRFGVEVVRAGAPEQDGVAWVAILAESQVESTMAKLPPATGSVVRLGRRIWFRAAPESQVTILAWECGKGSEQEAMASREVRGTMPGEELVRIELPAAE